VTHDDETVERELLREALEALDALLAEEMIYTGGITETLEASHMHPELAARARAAADKIRAALEHQQKGEHKP
jgi:hypothetical protein